VHISNDKLIGAGVTFAPGARANQRMRPLGIVAHDTATPDVEGHAMRYMTSGATKLAYHVIIERDGKCYFLVDFDRVAYHAGPSRWKNFKDLNRSFVGIAMANPGMMTKEKNGFALLRYRNKAGLWKTVDKFPTEQCVRMRSEGGRMGWWLPYTDAQLKTFMQVCKLLTDTYPSIRELVNHTRVDVRKWKNDTGPHFPLDEFRIQLFAKHQAPSGMLREGDQGDAVTALQNRLRSLGYQLGSVKPGQVFGPVTEQAVMAFQRENRLDIDGIVGPNTRAVLDSDTAKSFPTAGREGGSMNEARKTGSKIIQTAEAVEITGAASTAVLTVPPLITNAATTMEAVSKPLTGIQTAGEAISQFAVFLTTHWNTVAYILIALAAWYFGRRIKWRRYWDWATFKHIGN
jgi:N-acetyl-anhydromuramyl-L-alanine amidase AmpD